MPSPMSNRELFVEAAKAPTLREMIVFFGLRAAGGQYRQLHKWSEIHGVPLPEFQPDTTAARKANTYSDEEVFCENSKYTKRDLIKKRMVEKGVPEQCVLCGIGPKWNGSRLTLQLDHINGKHNDHRLENLRLLCPNCHSQTETFCGRSKSRNLP